MTTDDPTREQAAGDKSADAPDGANPEDDTGTTFALEALMPQIEALLISADRSLSAGRLSDLLGGPGNRIIARAILELNEVYERTGRAFRIEEVAGGWRMFCLAEYGQMVGQLHRARQQTRLTPATLETLAIIAYRQPILRADLEAIRGVACGETIRSLMDMRLVRIAGRAETLGRPMLYGTTRQFLEVFGLSSLKELPSVEEFKNQAARAGN
ncbi:MAG: SMC-Scp complex subunit ScpB [Phycisphaeraceae bacterium]|nr:SMC-Scp complex subunit ScpB [Phycisphaeraceae bacterium]